MTQPIRRGMVEGAKRRPARYESAGRDAPAPALREALRAHKQGDLWGARRAYHELLAVDPTSIDALMNLGTACVALGSGAEATRAFDAAIARAPLDARVHRDAAAGFAAIGRFEAAQVAWSKAIDLDASLIGARLSLSRMLLDTGDRAEALRHVRGALEREPAHAPAWLELFRIVFDDRDLDPAIAATERALACDDEYGLARYWLATMAGLTGDLGRAERELAILTRDPAAYAGAATAYRYAMEKRTPATRFFATRRETLLYALGRAGSEPSAIELGVRHGISTRWLAAAVRGPVFAFDSFLGLPVAWRGRPQGAFSTQGEVPELPHNVRLWVGWFEETLPSALPELPARIDFVHVDCDVFESTMTALGCLAPRLGPGSVLVFDEYFLNDGWQGDEHRALQDVARQEHWSYEYVAMSLVTGQAAIALR